jgi:hypothetical protein
MNLVSKSVVSAVAGIALVAVLACSSTPSATEWYFGDSLAMRVKEVRLVDQVGYALGDGHYVMEPRGEGRVLAAALLQIRNRQTNVVILSINRDSFSLVDTNNLAFRPVDPFQQAKEVPEAVAGENTMAPFIWGDGSEFAPVVQLRAKCGEDGVGCELVGWVFFEVPPGIEFGQLVWVAADTIHLRFE